MSDETEAAPTRAAMEPKTNAYAWSQAATPELQTAVKSRGWLIPVLIAVVSAAVVSVSATLLLDAKAMSAPRTPTYSECQYYR